MEPLRHAVRLLWKQPKPGVAWQLRILLEHVNHKPNARPRRFKVEKMTQRVSHQHQAVCRRPRGEEGGGCL